MGYIKGLAIFIDILGTKESDFCTLYKLNEIFHKELNRFKDKETLCQKFVTSFSDCAYLIYTIDEKDVSAFHFFIHEALVDLTYVISTIFVNGYMCRGGISYGELYFEKETKFVFGPAINKAYELEREAKMPRIILDDDFYNEFYKKEDIIIKDRFQKIVRKDTIDDRYYLNYLYAFSQFDYLDYDEGLFYEKIQLGNRKYSFEEYYHILETNSIETIKKTNDHNIIDHNIISKHKWQLNYLEQHKEERKRTVPDTQNV